MKEARWDIFLSYMHSDRKRVRRLVRRLTRKGWSVWWDLRILPGQPFDKIIEQTLESARCVIVVWSKASIQSDWVKDEATFARKKHTLIPILLDAVAIPLGFGRLQTANLAHWRGNDSDPEFKRLIAALEARLGKPKPAVSPFPHWLNQYAKIPVQNLAEATADLIKSRARIFRKPKRANPLVKTKASSKFIDVASPGLAVLICVLFLIVAFLGLRFYDFDKIGSQSSDPKTALADSLGPGTDILPDKQGTAPQKQTFTSRRQGPSMNAGKTFAALSPVLTLRTRPDSLTEAEVKTMLQNYEFYDSEWNPRARTRKRAPQYQIIQHDSVILDPLTGLMWQQSGSPNQMSFADAEDYITELNRTGFAGFYDWRIPTLAEAMSLVRSEKTNGFLHLDGVFDSRQCWIWTLDVKKGLDWHWIVIFIDGRCYDNIFGDDHYIRAVRTIR